MNYLDNEDREFIEQLLGYATQYNWNQFDKELPTEADIERDENDYDTVSPMGGVDLPFQRFYRRHLNREHELEKEKDV